MKQVMAFLVIFALALGGSGWISRRFARLTGTRGGIAATSGFEFLVAGVLMGENFLGFLDRSVMLELSPLAALVLGGIGFLCGSDLEIKRVGTFPKGYIKAVLLQAGVTVAATSFFTGVALWTLGETLPGCKNCAPFMLGAVAVSSSPAALAVCRKKLGINTTMEILIFIAALDALLAIAIFGLPFSSRLPSWNGAASWAAPLAWFMGSLLLGAALGFVLHVLARHRCSQQELVLFTLGVVVLGGALSSKLGMCSLVTNAGAGIVAGNLEPGGARIRRVILSVERPMYLVLLILVGASLDFDAVWPLAVASAYIAARTVGKSLGVALGSAAIGTGLGLGPGLALLPQGGVALALAMSMVRAAPGPVANGLLLSVVVAFLVQELAASLLVRKVLVNTR